MTNLDDAQQALLDEVGKAYEAVKPALKKMRTDYEYAAHQAKNLVREAVEAAVGGGVPMSRITTEGTDFKYPQKFKAWLQPHEMVIEAMMDNTQIIDTTVYADDIKSISLVTRDPSTGVFSVDFNGETFHVHALGSDREPWTTLDENIPEEVYAMISEDYPKFIVLEDDDD